jgi:hypothetical protein
VGLHPLPDLSEPGGTAEEFPAGTVACQFCQTKISSRLLECPACGAPQFPLDLGTSRF